ncbi:aromatic ring-hydroxylating oxygenase subunit alpha [Novosphingobium sp. JCM 18896]|uniref:aromatic ring-hydroxylating oxygenase subunit alpha n=1 Tax=Novosphingobium sp. JCM 18896 TaxID=2989731 RepID=UPI0022232388|nr:aromatic ring-hydroxylating dioxygenase subunit alpha [Novosphingobium sp. JCM 18896]MCW1429519.1 aromatic ring-hydroxylating dioxygenase subunit alpha [Novosphingobium sp. JCM 18896]
MPSNGFPSEEVRSDFYPKADYLDRRFHDLEKEQLWPKVWQIACREDEIPGAGDYVVYDIIDDSIVVVRGSDGEVRAFHNFCPHRGNLLVEGQGNARQFVCSFHGWRFGSDGRNIKVIDRQDWGDCLAKGDADLVPVQVGTWGGWVWINMDPDCQPLDRYLEPMKSKCELFEFEKLHPAWYKSVVVEANWKTTMGAFTEFYHVQTTHSQMLTYTQDYSTSRAMGRHGWISYEGGTGLPVGRSPRLPAKEVADFREHLFEYAEQFRDDLQAMQTQRAFDATQRLRTETTAETPPHDVVAKWGQFIYEAAIESGAGWPEGLTPEYLAESGFDWHVFPNTVFLHPAIEAVLWYRFRPHGDDHTRCMMDVWSLERFAPGAEPKVEHEVYQDWRDGDFPLIFRQDFLNIPKVQKGMKSRAFKGGRPSPIQERALSHFHKTLRRFLEDPHADDDLGPEPKVAAPAPSEG